MIFLLLLFTGELGSWTDPTDWTWENPSPPLFFPYGPSSVQKNSSPEI